MWFNHVLNCNCSFLMSVLEKRQLLKGPSWQILYFLRIIYKAGRFYFHIMQSRIVYSALPLKREHFFFMWYSGNIIYCVIDSKNSKEKEKKCPSQVSTRPSWRLLICPTKTPKPKNINYTIIKQRKGKYYIWEQGICKLNYPLSDQYSTLQIFVDELITRFFFLCSCLSIFSFFFFCSVRYLTS